jgi:2,5-diamino-6-(ribosylamino)-4(3H)-pyrimidinone 5'-phosphate reductase
MRPHVTVHNAVSLDGRLLEWEMVDMGLYYGLIGVFDEQATLAGADTMAFGAAHEGVVEDDPDASRVEPVQGDARPLLVVPDSRGRVRIWRWMLSQSYWRAGVALCSDATPETHLDYLERVGVDRITAGDDHVDLAASLEILRDRYGIERVRADSGGTLNGVLLRLGLVDAVSLLVAPVLMGDDRSLPFYRAPGFPVTHSSTSLKLVQQERLEGDHLWLRYEVVR